MSAEWSALLSFAAARRPRTHQSSHPRIIQPFGDINIEIMHLAYLPLATLSVIDAQIDAITYQ
jgi:hypothetical protein